ncbi:MAG TPA: hypothetical protein VKY15_08725 [Acidimicrobiales bacterium]|nr:hypothetical protein [Acidimicrobiales bacterium]
MIQRWYDPTQPQTLRNAVVFLYISGVFNLLIGAYASLLGLAIFAGQIVGGVGIANERRWGYWLAVVAAAVPLVLLAYLAFVAGFGVILASFFSLAFGVALLALLLHPMSRDYQRLHFH